MRLKEILDIGVNAGGIVLCIREVAQESNKEQCVQTSRSLHALGYAMIQILNQNLQEETPYLVIHAITGIEMCARSANGEVCKSRAEHLAAPCPDRRERTISERIGRLTRGYGFQGHSTASLVGSRLANMEDNGRR